MAYREPKCIDSLPATLLETYAPLEFSIAGYCPRTLSELTLEQFRAIVGTHATRATDIAYDVSPNIYAKLRSRRIDESERIDVHKLLPSVAEKVRTCEYGIISDLQHAIRDGIPHYDHDGHIQLLPQAAVDPNASGWVVNHNTFRLCAQLFDQIRNEEKGLIK